MPAQKPMSQLVLVIIGAVFVLISVILTVLASVDVVNDQNMRKSTNREATENLTNMDKMRDTLILPDTGVTPGTYFAATLSVNAQGFVTKASHGPAIQSVTAGDGLAGGTIADAGMLRIPDQPFFNGFESSVYLYPKLTVNSSGFVTRVTEDMTAVAEIRTGSAFTSHDSLITDTGTIALVKTVEAGTYPNAEVTVGSDGRILRIERGVLNERGAFRGTCAGSVKFTSTFANPPSLWATSSYVGVSAMQRVTDVTNQGFSLPQVSVPLVLRRLGLSQIEDSVVASDTGRLWLLLRGPGDPESLWVTYEATAGSRDFCSPVQLADAMTLATFVRPVASETGLVVAFASSDQTFSMRLQSDETWTSAVQITAVFKSGSPVLSLASVNSGHNRTFALAIGCADAEGSGLVVSAGLDASTWTVIEDSSSPLTGTQSMTRSGFVQDQPLTITAAMRHNADSEPSVVLSVWNLHTAPEFVGETVLAGPFSSVSPPLSASSALTRLSATTDGKGAWFVAFANPDSHDLVLVVSPQNPFEAVDGVLPAWTSVPVDTQHHCVAPSVGFSNGKVVLAYSVEGKELFIAEALSNPPVSGGWSISSVPGANVNSFYSSIQCTPGADGTDCWEALMSAEGGLASYSTQRSVVWSAFGK